MNSATKLQSSIFDFLQIYFLKFNLRMAGGGAFRHPLDFFTYLTGQQLRNLCEKFAQGH